MLHILTSIPSFRNLQIAKEIEDFVSFEKQVFTRSSIYRACGFFCTKAKICNKYCVSSSILLHKQASCQNFKRDVDFAVAIVGVWVVLPDLFHATFV
jgi:hypothetical protein